MKKYLLHCFIAIGLLIGFLGFAAAAQSNDPIQIQVCKQKEQTVRLSPNPTSNGALTVVSESKDPLNFYVFDVEGTMLYHALLKPGAKQTVDALKKGIYTYDVFRHDEGVEQGKITVL